MRLVLTAVLLVVELFGLLASVALGLLTVEEVEALGFEKLVDFGASDAGEHLLSELVVGAFAVSLLTLLVFAHGNEAGTEADGLVRELRLVLLGVLVICLYSKIEGGIGKEEEERGLVRRVRTRDERGRALEKGRE